mgnify:CR=1 FL=1
MNTHKNLFPTSAILPKNNTEYDNFCSVVPPRYAMILSKKYLSDSQTF